MWNVFFRENFQTMHKLDPENIKNPSPFQPSSCLVRTWNLINLPFTSVWRLSKVAHEQTRLRPLARLAILSTSTWP